MRDPAARTKRSRRSLSQYRLTCGCASLETIAAHGGLLVSWAEKPILTRLGRLSVFSLGDLRKITEDGVLRVADQWRQAVPAAEVSMQIQKA